MAVALEELKQERERFVAFAFASAEAFLEIDNDGKILFTGGATDHIFPASAPKLGDDLFKMVLLTDRDFLKVILQHLDHRVRMGPVPIRFGTADNPGPAWRLFALRMPGDPARTFLALRSAPLGLGKLDESDYGPTGMLKRDHFLDIASRTMSESRNGSLYMTVAEVSGLEEARIKLGQPATEKLLKSIAAHLKALSIDGMSASQIDRNQFAFLHREQKDGEHLDRSLATVDPELKLGARYATVSREGSGDEQQVMRTLSYILARFAEDPVGCNFANVAEAYDDFAADTQRRVEIMQHTIDTGAFKMAFQPIVSLTDNSVDHYEMLARFRETHDHQRPDSIIKFAEDLGMIGELDAAVFDKAVDYVRKMTRLGSHISLSVNISGRSLHDGLKVGDLMNKLTDAKDIAHHFLLELTETTAITNIDVAEKILAELKALGYRICLDDFGSGAAGYQYLRSFNVDFVKIHGQYIREMGTKSYNPSFLMSIVRLCSDLRIKTVGEHVENRMQADFLRAVGVDYGQGFYFGRPSDGPIST